MEADNPKRWEITGEANGTAAADYAQRGWPVLPVNFMAGTGRCSCLSADCGSPAKHPLTQHGLKDASTSEASIRDWWERWPNANVGIRTGTASGLVVVDVDDPAALGRLAEFGTIPKTLRVKTGKGFHLYFLCPAEAIRPRTAIIPGIDIRAEDSYVVAPPSVHASGRRYEFVDPTRPVAPLPEWLVTMATTPAPPRPDLQSGADGVFVEGERNDRLTRIGGSLVRQGIGGEPLTEILATANENTCLPPLERAEVERVARSVERYLEQPTFAPGNGIAGPDGAIHRQQTTSGQVPRQRFKLFSIDDVLNEPSPEWRVDGLLPAGSLSMIYAPQGQLKTFFGIDLALSVAHGIDFHGRRVKPGPVVYVLGEGRGGLKNRLRAWLAEHPLAAEHPACFVLEAVQFKSVDDVAELKARIDAVNIRPAMVFIDTFARSAVGLDENDAMQVGLWIDGVAALQREIEADVVTVHHAQKQSADGPGKKKVRERGSSAFIGAVDTVIRLHRATKTSMTITVSCEKQKDAEEFKNFTLAVKVIPLGKDEHGKAVSSCVLTESDAVAQTQAVVDECLPNASEMYALKVLSTLGPMKSGDWCSQIGAFLGKGIRGRSFQNWRGSLVDAGLVEEVGDGTAFYRVTAKGQAIADANGTPLKTTADPRHASRATPPKGVAGGRGQALPGDLLFDDEE